MTLPRPRDREYAPCVCGHDREEHEAVYTVTDRADVYEDDICHGAADCQCREYVERDEYE